TRLENALVMVTDPKQTSPIGIIRDAAGTASRARVGAWYSVPAERAKLFKVNYKLAWGDKTVQPDAFLTGRIVNDGDRETTSVVIEAFYKKDPQKLVKLAELDCTTDRSLLSDLGYSFALSRSALAKARTAADRDKVAARIARRSDEGQQVPPSDG